jgi:hypothetical protein
MKTRRKRYTIIGKGELCPKCSKEMERRQHSEKPIRWHYTNWDYCKPCGHLQHYEKFKSQDWQEAENQNDFFRNIK